MIAFEKNPLVRKLSASGALSEQEAAFLRRLHVRNRTFVAGRDLIHKGQSTQAAYIILDGWATAYKLMPDGARQIIDFQIPGDFLGLRSIFLRASDHSIEPVTDIHAAEIHVADLIQAFAHFPRLADPILWAVSRDEALIVEHLVDIGRRSASARTSHYLLELGVRLSFVGLGTRAGYTCPLTQYHLADALGLSAVHVNRVLRGLREDGLLTFQHGQVAFDDYDRLVDFAQFDATYLDQATPRLE